jgi:hypothetical protein
VRAGQPAFLTSAETDPSRSTASVDSPGDRRGGCVGFAEVELQVFDTGDGMVFRSGNLTVPFSALYGENSCSQASSCQRSSKTRPVVLFEN